MFDSITRYGFVRIATASPRLRVADCVYNAAQTIKLMQQAQRQGVAVLVFPELNLTGYTCADLFQHSTLQKGALEGLAEITRESQSFDGLVFVGLPLIVDDQLFNCAAVVQRGKVLGVVPKTFPPTARR